MGKGRAWMWRSRRKRPGTQPERRGYSYREMGEGSQRPSKPNGQQAYGKDTQICVSNQENTSLSLANMIEFYPISIKALIRKDLYARK